MSHELPTLTTALSHDLKNRLAVLTQELVTLEQKELPTDVRRHVANARAQSDVAVRMLTNFLIWSKVNTGELLCVSDLEGVPDFVAGVAERARLFLPAQVALTVDIDDAPNVWFFDHNLIQLALDAALDNAARYAKNQVQLRVVETSLGLLFQVENDLREHPVENPHSTGLGVKLAQALAQAHCNKGIDGRAQLQLHADRAVFSMLLP